MPTSFNLIDEPWIRVLKSDGQLQELSITRLFEDALEIESLSTETKAHDFAIFRLLLAVLYDAFREDFEDDPIEYWESIWNEKRFPESELSAYLSKWRESFDLLDGKQPFFQVADLRTSKDEWKDLSVLLTDSPGEGALFSHRDPTQPISLAEGARWLVYAMSYDISGIKPGCVGDPLANGGKSYPKGIGWCGWLGGTMVTGQNLFETLMLNLVADRELKDSDVPVWHHYPLHVGEMDVETGPVSLLTWPQRRIRLRIEGNQVTGALLTNGNNVEHQRQSGNELMTPFRFSDPQSKSLKDQIYMPAKLSGSRAMWRGFEGLLAPLNSQSMIEGYRKVKVVRNQRARTLDWADKLVEERVISRDMPIKIQIISVEYGTHNSAIECIYSDSLTVNAEMLLTSSVELRQTAINAISVAESAAMALKNLASNLRRAEGGAPTNELRGKVEGQFFFRLDEEFQRWLLDLSGDRSLELSAAVWVDIVRGYIDAFHQQLVAAANSSVIVGHRVEDRVFDLGFAERVFWSERNKALGNSHSKVTSMEKTK